MLFAFLKTAGLRISVGQRSQRLFDLDRPVVLFQQLLLLVGGVYRRSWNRIVSLHLLTIGVLDLLDFVWLLVVS